MSATPPPSAGQLARVLGPWTATAIVVGTVIGSGVFKKPAEVARHMPEFGPAMLAWVAGGVLAVLGALALAEVAVMLPRAGGNYVFLKEAYGRWAGFLWGWVDFGINRSASVAALSTIFAESASAVLDAIRGTPLDDECRQLLTVAVILALALVNIRGTKQSGLLQLFLTVVKVGTILGLVVLPFAVLAVPRSAGAAGPNIGLLSPVWPASWSAFSWVGFGAAVSGVLWAYHGWMNVVPMAGEVREPQRNLPLALLGGTGLVMALYLSVNLSYHLVLSRDVLASLTDETVAARFCRELIGPTGAALASAAVMISVFGAINGNLLVGPRLLYAMGDDGLAPQQLSAVHPRFGTPHIAIAAVAAWASLLVMTVPLLKLLPHFPPDKASFDTLTDFVIFGSVTFETLAVLTIFPLRRRLAAATAYRCPGFPVVPALYAVLMALVLASMTIKNPTQTVVATAFVAIGAAVYAAVYAGRRGTHSES